MMLTIDASPYVSSFQILMVTFVLQFCRKVNFNGQFLKHWVYAGHSCVYSSYQSGRKNCTKCLFLK